MAVGHLENTSKYATIEAAVNVLSISLSRREEASNTMKKRLSSYFTVAATLAVVTLLCISNSHAQASSYTADQAKQEKAKADAEAAKNTPRMADGHPDFSGFWLNGVSGLASYSKATGGADDGNLLRTKDGSIFFAYAGTEAEIPNEGKIDTTVPDSAPPYKPEYMAKVQDLVKGIYGFANTSSPSDPMNECKPNGVPRSGISGTQIIMNPKGMIIAYENDPGPVYRIVYMDGRQHPADLDTSYMGHSIGHWEGDTLVVDTVGLNDETWLGGGKYQAFHSDKLHVVEKITRVGDVLTRSFTAEDPVMFTKPWNSRAERVTLGNKDDYVQPEMCRTNDKDHLIHQTDSNVYRCDFCVIDPDKDYGKGATDANKQNGAKSNTVPGVR